MTKTTTCTGYPVEYRYSRYDGGHHLGIVSTAEEAVASLSAFDDPPTRANLVTVEAGITMPLADIEECWANEIAAGWARPIHVYGGWRIEIETWRVSQ